MHQIPQVNNESYQYSGKEDDDEEEDVEGYEIENGERLIITIQIWPGPEQTSSKLIMFWKMRRSLTLQKRWWRWLHGGRFGSDSVHLLEAAQYEDHGRWCGGGVSGVVNMSFLLCKT